MQKVPKTARIYVPYKYHQRVKAFAALRGISLEKAYALILGAIMDERGEVDVEFLERLWGKKRKTI